MAAAAEMAKGPHLRSIDCVEMMTSKRRSQWSFELAGGSVFATAHKLSDGVLSAAMAERRCFALGGSDAREKENRVQGLVGGQAGKAFKRSPAGSSVRPATARGGHAVAGV